MSGKLFDKKQQVAYNSFKNGYNLLITGVAGSGKSFLIDSFKNYINKETDKIITITSYYLLNKSSHWSELQDTISRVQNMNPKEHAGFTSKSKFRYCDIQDFIKKQNIKQ